MNAPKLRTFSRPLWRANSRLGLQLALIAEIVAMVMSASVAAAAAKDASRPIETDWDAVALWSGIQLIPSPILVGGNRAVGGGLRWQVTPLLYSFGVAARPARFFIVAPVARHSGALEFYGSPEWTCCVRPGDSGWLARAGARLYWPLIGRGESLAMSLGGSYYYENHRHGGAGELGFYTLSSIVGITVTLSPWLTGREGMVAMALHFY